MNNTKTDLDTLDGGEAMLEALRALNIDYIFSSPGSEWGGFWEALARAQVKGTPGPRFISCWHETLAVDLALGYTLATGRMQAVVLHAGVGLLQGSMAIHAAYIQNLPVLVFSGETLTYGERAGFDPGAQWYQNLSIVGGTQRFVEAFVKWGGQASSVETLYSTIVRGGEIAQRTPLGPVYISVPIETQLAAWKKPKNLAKTLPVRAPQAPRSEIEVVAKLLKKATDPVIVTEAAGRDRTSYEALLAFAEKFAIPVVETPSSMFSNFPKEHPLHQGPSLAPLFETTDLVLVIRSRVPFYPANRRPPSAAVVLIDENPYRSHMAYQNLPADAVLEGDITHTLEVLTDITDIDAETIVLRRERYATSHASADQKRLNELTKAKIQDPIDPGWLCTVLSDVLPANTVYVDETITHRGIVESHLRNKGPGSFLKVRGGLGQVLGHALGAKIALPNQPVVALVGDGTFLYNPISQSLGFAQQSNLGILVVIFNNKRYLAMKLDHARYYPEGVSKRENIYVGQTIGSDPQLSTLGDAFGCWGRRIERSEELPDALREAYSATLSGRTAILDVIVDP